MIAAIDITIAPMLRPSAVPVILSPSSYNANARGVSSYSSYLT